MVFFEVFILLASLYVHNENIVNRIKTYTFNNLPYINSIQPVFINNIVVTAAITIMGRLRFTFWGTQISRHTIIHKYITSSNVFSLPVIYHSVHITTIGKAARILAIRFVSFACHITAAHIGEISDILLHKIICVFGKKTKK